MLWPAGVPGGVAEKAQLYLMYTPQATGVVPAAISHFSYVTLLHRLTAAALPAQ